MAGGLPLTDRREFLATAALALPGICALARLLGHDPLVRIVSRRDGRIEVTYRPRSVVRKAFAQLHRPEIARLFDDVTELRFDGCPDEPGPPSHTSLPIG